MANMNRGEYDLVVDGETHTLIYTLDDLANLETAQDIGADALFSQIRSGQGRIAHINAVILRGLIKGQPRITRKEAEDLLPKIPFTDRKLAAGMLIAGALNYLNEQQEAEEEENQSSATAGKEKQSADPLSVLTEN